MMNLQHLCSVLFSKFSKFFKSSYFFITITYRFIILRVNSFSIQLFYFLSISSLGFSFLKFLKTRIDVKPRNLDLFFTSVSATTVSSMSTLEIEVFSNLQLLILTLLMFIGGEVFLSMVGLFFSKSKLLRPWKNDTRVNFSSCESLVPDTSLETQQVSTRNIEDQNDQIRLTRHESRNISLENRYLKYKSIKFLGFLVLGYLLITHTLGVSLVSLYMSIIPSAKQVLKQKGLNTFTFSIFTIVSTFSSCGFVPTNENMIIFSKNSGLLWILIPQLFFGNTLYPSCLRFLIWFFGKFFKKEEANYLLENTTRVGYFHLLSSQHCWFLVVSVFGFVLIQFVLFCSMEWNSNGLSELNVYQKIVGVLFQCVNSRHTGETIVDLSTIAPAILVLFVVMMLVSLYLALMHCIY